MRILPQFQLRFENFTFYSLSFKVQRDLNLFVVNELTILYMYLYGSFEGQCI